MTLTEEEQKICSYYSQTFADGKVGCSRCPLQVDRRWCVCKANCTEEEWKEREEERTGRDEAERKMLKQMEYEFDAAVNAVPVRHGKWIEKHHAYSDEESVIEEWQSCRCSECGRYDTRPYMYYFDEPNYCSYCSAKMDEEEK